MPQYLSHETGQECPYPLVMCGLWVSVREESFPSALQCAVRTAIRTVSQLERRCYLYSKLNSFTGSACATASAIAPESCFGGHSGNGYANNNTMSGQNNCATFVCLPRSCLRNENAYIEMCDDPYIIDLIWFLQPFERRVPPAAR